MVRRPIITGLPRTGQVTEYQSGDDGTFQAGHPSTSRFVDNGDGTVRDTLYTPELMWVRTPHLIIPTSDGLTANNEILSAEGVWNVGNDYITGDVVQGDGAPDALFYACILANGPGGVGAQEPPNATYWVVTPWIGSAANLTTPGTHNWEDTIINCEALDYAGYTDWRMSNRNELLSLYDSDNATSPSVFPPFVIQDNKLWSSSTRKASPTSADFVSFGTNLFASSELKTQLNPAMPIRGGKTNA